MVLKKLALLVGSARADRSLWADDSGRGDTNSGLGTRISEPGIKVNRGIRTDRGGGDLSDVRRHCGRYRAAFG